VTAWPTSTAVAAGVLRRQSATPTVGNERGFACIVAGTTSGTGPSPWIMTKGAKTTDGGVTWQECTGQPGLNGDTTNCPSWPLSTAYALGQVIKGVTNSVLFICSTAGTSGGSEPSWSTTAGQTTTDNTVTWTSLGAASGFTAFMCPFARLQSAYAANWMTAGEPALSGRRSRRDGLCCRYDAHQPKHDYAAMPDGLCRPHQGSSLCQRRSKDWRECYHNRQ